MDVLNLLKYKEKGYHSILCCPAGTPYSSTVRGETQALVQMQSIEHFAQKKYEFLLVSFPGELINCSCNLLFGRGRRMQAR